MKAKRVLPYLAALLFLAWSLGTLARSGPSSRGLLVNSYWLLYAVYLLPLLGFVGMIVMVVILALEWRVISDVIGMGLAARRGQKAKKRRRLPLIIAGAAWAVALMVVYYRCPGFHCQTTNTQSITQVVEQNVFNNTATPQYLPLSGSIANITGFFSTDWYIFPFMALIIIGGIILARGVWVSAGETRRVGLLLTPRVQEEGQAAVREAMSVLAANEEADPGSRIIACYQRMVRGSASLGAAIGPDLTARELEA